MRREICWDRSIRWCKHAAVNTVNISRIWWCKHAAVSPGGLLAPEPIRRHCLIAVQVCVASIHSLKSGMDFIRPCAWLSSVTSLQQSLCKCAWQMLHSIFSLAIGSAPSLPSTAGNCAWRGLAAFAEQPVTAVLQSFFDKSCSLYAAGTPIYTSASPAWRRSTARKRSRPSNAAYAISPMQRLSTWTLSTPVARRL
jgi:hypothetical protein